MTTFVLIVVIWTGGGFSSGQTLIQEFNSRDSCLKAAALIKTAVRGSTFAECTEK